MESERCVTFQCSGLTRRPPANVKAENPAYFLRDQIYFSITKSLW